MVNELKEARKAKKKGRKVESNVKRIEDMVWERDTGNPITDNFHEFPDKVGGTISIEGYKYEVRMPLRKYVKHMEHVTRNYDETKGEIYISDEELYRTSDIMEEMIYDMIPMLESDDEVPFRMDDILWNQIASFCWTFYHFFGQKSKLQQNGVSSSNGV